MKLFDLKGGSVIVTPEALLIPEFKVLWKRDEDKDKEQAIRDMSYLYFISDYKSPYVISSDEFTLAPMVAKDFMKDENYEPDEALKTAIEKYKELQLTPSMKLLIASIKTINNLVAYLESVDLQERDRVGKPIYKPTDITNSLARIGGIVESLNKVKEQVERETIKSGTLRGQRRKGNREDPNI